MSASPKTLNREAVEPLYAQIANHLADEIRAGRFKAFEKLPSEHRLMEMFAVSRVTVRLAIGRLTELGLAVARQGKGVFVAGPVVNHELSTLRGFYDGLVAQGHTPSTTLVLYETLSAELADVPALAGAKEDIYHFQRLYLLEGQPIALADAYLPSAGKALTREDFEQFPVYAIAGKLLNRAVVKAEVRMRATGASGAVAELLGLDEGSPCMVMHRTSLDAKGLIVEMTRFTICPDTFEFALDVGGPMQIGASIHRVAT
jgi:GntR family transcriptional regulator